MPQIAVWDSNCDSLLNYDLEQELRILVIGARSQRGGSNVADDLGGNLTLSLSGLVQMLRSH